MNKIKKKCTNCNKIVDTYQRVKNPQCDICYNKSVKLIDGNRAVSKNLKPKKITKPLSMFMSINY